MQEMSEIEPDMLPGGGASGFQVTEFPNHKNFPESIKWYNTKIGPFNFEHQKKSLLKIKLVPQKILAKIFLPKSIPKLKISNPEKSFKCCCHLKSRVPPSQDLLAR